jgi:hypothetical protein
MKRISIAIIMAVMLCCSNQASAQLGNLLKKAKKEEGGAAAGSSKSDGAKLYTVRINGKKRGGNIMSFSKYLVIKEVAKTESQLKNSPAGSGTINLQTRFENENGAGSSGPFLNVEIIKDELYTDEESYFKKINNQTMVIFKMGDKAMNKSTIDDVEYIDLITSDKAVIDDLNSKTNSSQHYTFARAEVEKVFDILRQREGKKFENDVIEWETQFKDIKLPPVSTFQTPVAKTKGVEAIKVFMKKKMDDDEYMYSYQGYEEGRMENPTKWILIKEERRTNAGFEKIVVRRSIPLVVVAKSPKGTYAYYFMYLLEDTQPAVTDGSKFTGEYYITGFQGPHGIAKANAMANKGK